MFGWGTRTFGVNHGQEQSIFSLGQPPRTLRIFTESLNSASQNEDHARGMNSADNELSLAPLGLGDLIDRAVRLYRRDFLTLVRIAAPPVLVFAMGSAISTIAFRELTATADEMCAWSLCADVS